MKLYVIRHGETDINVQNRINSLNDEDLNENGINQAKNTREKLKQVDYDFIICSPMTRTKHTAEILNYKNADIIYDERLLERDAGVLTKASLDNIDCNDWWNINPKEDYFNAETVEHVIERVSNFLNNIKEKYKDKTLVLVTHGGTLKAINCYFNGIPEDGCLEKYKFENCGIYEFELK